MEPMELGISSEPSTSHTSPVSFHNSTSAYYGSSSSSFDDNIPSISNDLTLDDILADLPDDILSGCGPEEVFRPDYKEVLFPRKRPDNVPFAEPTPSVFHEEEILDPEDCFYFESEHLALKGNKDYLDLLKTIVLLHAQRAQAIKDLEELLLAKKKALENPIAYVAKLQNGELPEYPGPQKIPVLPTIDWSKYNVSQPDNQIRPQTRHAKNEPPDTEVKPESKEEKVLIRGRVYDETKPKTFNQRWSAEEQRHLQYLLEKYPYEEIAMNRWTKIANELGNRTPKQVASRVQKYFLKLKSAGITSDDYYIKSTNNIKKRAKRFNKTTTFFPYNQYYNGVKTENIQEESDESQTSMSTDYNADLKQIQLITQTKLEKDKCNNESMYAHLGHKCYICNEEPIKYIVWHCEDCYDQFLKNVDLCTDCAYAQIKKDKPRHPINHRLVRIEPPKSSDDCLDSAYHAQNFNDVKTNYLDTNFCPQ